MNISVCYWLWMLFNENKEAVLQMPTEMKWLVIAVLGICVVSGLCSKIWKLVSTALVLIGIYMLITFFGLI